MRIVLFDIDGTLLRSGGIGRVAMERALTNVFGVPGSMDYRYDGKTDRQIVPNIRQPPGINESSTRGLDKRPPDRNIVHDAFQLDFTHS